MTKQREISFDDFFEVTESKTYDYNRYTVGPEVEWVLSCNFTYDISMFKDFTVPMRSLLRERSGEPVGVQFSGIEVGRPRVRGYLFLNHFVYFDAAHAGCDNCKYAMLAHANDGRCLYEPSTWKAPELRVPSSFSLKSSYWSDGVFREQT